MTADELVAMEKKATALPHTISRYDNGGGRCWKSIPRADPLYRGEDSRTRVADFYNEGDRELFLALRNLAPQLAALWKAAELPRNTRLCDTAELTGEWVAVPKEDFDKLRAALAALREGGKSGA